jgi:import receptor subunit TOM22
VHKNLPTNTLSTDSEISDDEDDSPPLEETLADRLFALKDIIPPPTRSYISSAVSTTSSYLLGGLGFGGKALYVLSTSALLLGVPWALAFAEEQQMVEMEKEMRMREMGSEVRHSQP